MIDWPYVFQFLSTIFVVLAITKNNKICFVIFIFLSFISFVFYPCMYAYEDEAEKNDEENKESDEEE